MASIAARHSYRFGYLKSEHWSNIRLQKLAKENGKCAICLKEDRHNDVHHIRYKKSLYETTLGDLRPLCRECHTLIHKLSDEFPEACPNRNERRWRWKFLKSMALARLRAGGKRIRKRPEEKQILGPFLSSDKIKAIFRQARGRLYFCEFPAIFKWEMPWHDSLIQFYTRMGTPTDIEWLEEAQRLAGWKTVWPQGEH